MRDCSRARYAAAAVIDLAHQIPTQPTTLAEIAKRQDISVSYLEQLFACLRAAGLLKSVRGPGGGYVLARATDQITIAEIYSAVLEHAPERKRDAIAMSPSGAQIKAAALWQAMDRQTNSFLQSLTVQDVLAGNVASMAGPRLSVVNQ